MPEIPAACSASVCRAAVQPSRPAAKYQGKTSIWKEPPLCALSIAVTTAFSGLGQFRALLIATDTRGRGAFKFPLCAIAMSPLPIDASAPPILGPESAGMLMTPEEFDEVTEYDDGFRYELIRGVLVVAPIPAESESAPNDELGSMLRQFQREHPQGTMLDETLPERYIRTASGRRRADRVIWIGLGRRPDPTVDVPAIAVEFVSTSRRDRRRDYSEKRLEYQAARVGEHWIVDRFVRKMTVYRNSSQQSIEVIVTEHETYQTPLLPGFELPLARLLTVADRWG